MASRKVTPATQVTPEDTALAAFLATPNQAVAARMLGVNGKAFRTITRNIFGVYVSHDDAGAWDERTKRYRYAYHNASGDARKALVAAWKAGDELPPTE